MLSFPGKNDFPTSDNTTKIFDWLTVDCLLNASCTWEQDTKAEYRQPGSADKDKRSQIDSWGNLQTAGFYGDTMKSIYKVKT